MEEEYNADNKEKNVYKEESREQLVDDAEISPREAAFMKGYEEDTGDDELEEIEDEENTK